MARRVAPLEIVPDIAGIVKVYVQNQVMPADDAGDAAHLAVASYHGVDYLLTWNTAGIWPTRTSSNIFVRSTGGWVFLTPDLVTPEQLFAEV